MAKASLPVLDDPYFQLALGFAKGVAHNVGAPKLSALLLLAGFQLARGSAQSQVPKPVAENWEEIKRAASRLGLTAGKKIKPLKQVTFPLDENLKNLLNFAGTSLETLLPALLQAVPSTETPDDEAFETVVSYATAIAKEHGLSEITPEAFAAAAFGAFRDGCFNNRPAVAAHIAANKNAFAYT
jgi:hypothetical protein